MKVYISADIEGITGATHWDETDKQKPDYTYLREQMTAEVAAACQGALSAGATEIWVKDAHDTGRNIIASRLPEEVRLVRGWSGHPFIMAQELDQTFQAVIMIGYHSRAGADTSPLAHTMTGRVAHIKINDRYASEFLLHAYIAALVNVPVVFVSGDEGLCKEVKSLNPNIHTNAVMQGVGNSTVSIHPELAVKRTREGVQKALQGDLSRCRIPLPDHFRVEIRYKEHMEAYRCAFFPGASLKEPYTVQFESADYFEVLGLFLFTV
ncbi:MAG: M55 family metallopeptidase [Anaerolineae bacterium]|jgi:D-amino peptidase|nr:M55 family metallopeptidase [Anaerolineae bacterium]MDH7473421.1 M55 family metallopeptidase [Anaerolineae bacterium]